MPDQRIDQLNAETTPAAVDVLPVFSIAGADTKKITVKNLIQVGATLIDDASIPGSKVNLSGQLAGAIVNADINANAEIAVSKLVDGTARQLLQTDAAGTGVEWASNIDIPGTLDVTSAATFDSTVAVTGALTKSGSNVVTVGDTGTVTSNMLLDGTIVNADINASAGIVDTKLATIATAGKVSNSATSATNANTGSAIVARDASGNFTAGTITASLTGNASTVTTNANLTGDITSTGNATSIAAGVIVNADINASAAIDDTKLATISTAAKVSNSATTATNSNTASAIVARDASGNFTAGTITAALTGTASGNLVAGGALGTPASGTLTSCTGLPISTGVSGLGAGAATFLTTPSSANLAALLTDETGTGAAVFATSPTLVSPALGTPVSGVLTNCTNLPVATDSVVGGVSVPASGGFALTGGGALSHSNAVAGGASSRSGITYDLQGHIVSTVALVASDLPAATTAVKGAVIAGTGLAVDVNGILSTNPATTSDLGGIKIGSEFDLNGSNQLLLATQANVAGGTAYPKVTVNSKGIVTAGAALASTDIPNLDASKITTGSVDIARIGANTVTGAKIANYAVTKIGDTQPTADHIGQFFFNPLSRDLALFDGNVFQPIGISVGEIVFAGTYDASLGSGTGLISSVTVEGTAIGLAIGQALPAPAAGNSRYYLVVAEAGAITTGNAPHVALSPPDILLSNGISWTEIDVSQTITAQVASNVSFTPAGSIAAVNVQTAIQELDGDKLAVAGGTITGNLEIGAAGSLRFEGATANDFETIIALVDPTADRTITLPNVTGTVITTGDTNTITSTMLLDGTILNADVSASAAIVDTKLATISTALKVSNSATTAASANTASAIVARDASGNFTAGTITAAVTGAASSNVLKAGDTMTGNLTLNAQSDLRLADADSSHYIALQAPATITSNVTLTLPAADGTNGQVLTTNGTGTLSFTTAGGVDIISEGNSSAEVIDTGSDGRFVVTTEGSERARIDSSGRLLVGTSSSSAVSRLVGTGLFSGEANQQIQGAGVFAALSLITNRGGDGTGSFITLGKSRGSTPGSINIVNSGDDLGGIYFVGADGVDVQSMGAAIQAQVDGTPGANDMPGRLVFSTTSDSASSPTERMRINSAGALGVGGTNFGTAGQALISSGSTAVPTWQDLNAAVFGWDHDNDTYGLYLPGTSISTGALSGTININVQSSMRRCVINDSGVVQYYLDANDSTKKAATWLRLVETESLATAFTGAPAAEATNSLLRVGVPAWDSTIIFTRGQYVTHGGFLWEALTATTPTVTAGAFVVGVEYVIRTVGTTDFTLLSASANTVGVTFTATGVGTGTGTARETPQAGTVASVLDGTDGQVVVEIPAFSVRYGFINGVHTREVRLGCNDGLIAQGFRPHTAFIKTDGTYKSAFYWGAYQAYSDGTNLASVSGQTNTRSLTRATFRTRAALRGTGWHVQSYLELAAIQTLLVTEYRDYNSQKVVGNGSIEGSVFGVATGLSNSRGNRSGNVYTGGGSSSDFMSYRGIENLYGRAFTWADGINVYERVVYLTNNQSVFADNTSVGYNFYAQLPSGSSSFQKELFPLADVFLPSVVTGASSTTYLGDALFTGSGWLVASVGADSGDGSLAGAFCLFLAFASGSARDFIGARSAYAAN